MTQQYTSGNSTHASNHASQNSGASPSPSGKAGFNGSSGSGSRKGQSKYNASKTREIPTAGAILPDGTLLELLHDPSNTNPQLLCWQNGLVDVGPRLKLGDNAYVPLDLGADVPLPLRLPTRVAAEESPRELFTAVQGLFADLLGESESFAITAAATIFISWTADVLPMAPILFVNCSPTSPKFAMLSLMRALCRRPLLVAGARRGDFPSLPWYINPTLLLDEPELRPPLLRLLLSSSRRGVCTVSAGRVLNFYGCKIILTRESSNEMLGSEDVLRVSLMPTRSQPSVVDESMERQIAEEFQARLLGFRLRHHRGLDQDSKLEVNHLTAPAQDLARALCVALAGDPKLMERILPLLRAQDEESRSDRSNTIESVLIEALLSFCHEKKSSEIRVKELAERVNAIFAGRGSACTVSAEKIGWTLKQLHVPSGRIGSAGHGVRLADALVRLIHELAVAYDVPMVRVGSSARCDFCEKFSARR